MKRFVIRVGIACICLFGVAQVTHYLQFQTRAQQLESSPRLIAGHSMMRRLILNDAVRLCHGGEPLFVTSLAMKRLVDCGARPSAILISVSPHSFEQEKHRQRMKNKAWRRKKDMQFARAVSTLTLLNPQLNIPRRLHVLKWKWIPIPSTELQLADSFFLQGIELDAFLKTIARRQKENKGLINQPGNWTWHSNSPEISNLMELIRSAEAHSIPIIGVVSPEQDVSWEKVPESFLKAWRDFLDQLQNAYSVFHLIDLGQNHGLADDGFTDPCHLSPLGAGMIQNDLDSMVLQVEMKYIH